MSPAEKKIIKTLITWAFEPFQILYNFLTFPAQMSACGYRANVNVLFTILFTLLTTAFLKKQKNTQ